MIWFMGNWRCIFMHSQFLAIFSNIQGKSGKLFQIKFYYYDPAGLIIGDTPKVLVCLDGLIYICHLVNLMGEGDFIFDI